jgi:hypothetical protein
MNQLCTNGVGGGGFRLEILKKFKAIVEKLVGS